MLVRPVAHDKNPLRDAWGLKGTFVVAYSGNLGRVHDLATVLNNVLLRPYQPRDELAFSLSVADVHLVTLRPEFEGLVVPSKFYGVAAVGRPTLFVGDPGGEVARMIARHECGVSMRSGDGAALAAAIEALSHDRAGRDAMGRRARTMLETYFDRRIAMEQWFGALEALPERHGREQGRGRCRGSCR
jgi:hypothetical protein